MEDLIELLCGDERVSACGLYVEGIQDIERIVTTRAFAAPAEERELGSDPNSGQ